MRVVSERRRFILIADCFAAWEKIVANEGASLASSPPLALGLGVSAVLNGNPGSASSIRGRPYIAVMSLSCLMVVIVCLVWELYLEYI